MPDKGKDSPVAAAEFAALPPAYQKCIKCPNLGIICGGQKITALQTIAAARSYHRALRWGRNIPMKRIYPAAPSVSEGTIDDYFGRAAQDFKWTTVATIDNALIAIIGDRVGQCPIENPCPDAIVELRDRCESLVARLDEAAAENARLSQALATAEGNIKTQLANQRADLERIIRMQEAQIVDLKRENADYLSRNDAKRLEIQRANQKIQELTELLARQAGEFADKILALLNRIAK